MRLMRKIMNWARRDHALAPARAMLHPAWLLALSVLVINDHVLKHSALAGPVTGKLSDFAGLFLAPALFAAIIGVRSRRGLMAAAAAVGAVFSAINTIPPAAAAWDALLSHTFVWTTTVDPTDLLALVALPAGVWILEPSMRRARAHSIRRALELALVTVGALASLATSQPCDDDFCGEFQGTREGQVSILNKTDELHVFRVRAPRGGVEFDCDVVAEDPPAYLDEGIFGPPIRRMVQSGQEIAVQPLFGGTGRTCETVLIESDTAPSILVFWDASLPAKTFPFDAEIPREVAADPATLVLEADYSRVPDDEELKGWRARTNECPGQAENCADQFIEPLTVVPPGARYSWTSTTENLMFSLPAVEGTIPVVPAECEMPSAREGVAWETPPAGEWSVVSIEPGIDGCHQLRLSSFDPLESNGAWWLCVPYDSLASLQPGEDGSYADIDVRIDNQGATPAFDSNNRGGYEALRIGVTRRSADGEFDSLHQIWVSRGFRLPGPDFEAEVVRREGCAPVHEACGQASVPGDLEIRDWDVTISPGESATVGDVLQQEVFVVRAVARLVTDRLCESETSAGLVPASGVAGYIEAVVVGL